MSKWPIAGTYNVTSKSKLAPGLYLGLFHGRKDKDQRMNGWGTNGPIIGPLAFVQTTYCNALALTTPDGTDLDDIEVDGDCVLFGGVYYGDWTVFDSRINAYGPQRGVQAG